MVSCVGIDRRHARSVEGPQEGAEKTRPRPMDRGSAQPGGTMKQRRKKFVPAPYAIPSDYGYNLAFDTNIECLMANR